MRPSRRDFVKSVAASGIALSLSRLGASAPPGFPARPTLPGRGNFNPAANGAGRVILLDHRDIGSSTDDGKPFDIAQLADDAAHVIEALGLDRTSVLGWSMGGFIAQTLAVQHPDRVKKVVLLSTDPGGTDADLASTTVWSQLIDTTGTPHDQARRLLSLLFPGDVAESFYREYGDIVAAARARLSPGLIERQAA